ncbi:MAG TPA: ABC transporter transmembrane domain-containing protein, partial [Methylotenera sp.]|nr:ABC transporter transmembrane domain-containing protein [Methylotenera sp.]
MSKSLRKSNHKKDKPHIANAKGLYLRLFRYIWVHKLYFFITIVATTILAASNTGFLALIKQVTDEGFVEQSADKLNLLPLMLFGLMTLRGLAGFISTYSMKLIARKIVEALRKTAFAKMMQLSAGFYDSHQTSVMVSKLTYDTERISTACTRSVLNVLRDVLTVIGLIGYMLYLDWRLTLVFAVVTPFMALYLAKMTPKLRANAQKVQLGVGEMTKVAEEAISGQRIVKIFGAQDYENERFSNVVGKNRQLELRTTRISGLSSLVVEMLAAFAL